MQALVVVCYDELPVCVDVVNNSLLQAQFRHAPSGKSRGQISKLSRQRPRMGLRIKKDVAIPKTGAKLVKRVVLVVKHGRIHVGRAKESAVESVGPAMVRTLDPSREAALRL